MITLYVWQMALISELPYRDQFDKKAYIKGIKKECLRKESTRKKRRYIRAFPLICTKFDAHSLSGPSRNNIRPDAK
jgi:hypothetical protein